LLVDFETPAGRPALTVMALKKNSLVANINRRKKAGTSRTKEESTISARSYKQMQEGWPKSGRKAAKKK